MSIFQSCRILVFYSLNERIQGVQKENIYHDMVFFANFGRKTAKYVKSVQCFQVCVFLTYFAVFEQNLRRKPRHVIYFLHVLLKSFRLSYRTLKSDNFEKLTYNANMFFQFAKKAHLKMPRLGPNFFFCRSFIPKRIIKFGNKPKVPTWVPPYQWI